MKIGRLLMIGFNGTELSQEFKLLIQKHGIGGFVLFERNLKEPAQILSLNRQLYSVDKDFVPLIAIDQEGGRVQRLKSPFVHLPSARKVGEYYRKYNSIDSIYEYGSFIAEEISITGFNMNLTPVLDLSDKEDGVIGDRAFSNTPLIVEEIGVSIIAGMQDRGVVACAKHFPGNTDTQIDPHRALPFVHIKPEKLYHNLSPFIHAINNDVGSVMVSHTLFKGIDDVPASMSKKIVNGLLKSELHFKGIVITDDVKMGAISKKYSVADAVIQALSANVDMIMISNLSIDEYENIIDRIESSIAEGIIKKEQINNSLLRIELVKNTVGIKKELVYDEQDVLKLIHNNARIAFIKKFL